MKAYKWITLSAPIAITAAQGPLFTNASSIVSPVEVAAAVGIPEATLAVATELAGLNEPSKFGEMP